MTGQQKNSIKKEVEGGTGTRLDKGGNTNEGRKGASGEATEEAVGAERVSSLWNGKPVITEEAPRKKKVKRNLKHGSFEGNER